MRSIHSRGSRNPWWPLATRSMDATSENRRGERRDDRPPRMPVEREAEAQPDHDGGVAEVRAHATPPTPGRSRGPGPGRPSGTSGANSATDRTDRTATTTAAATVACAPSSSAAPRARPSRAHRPLRAHQVTLPWGRRPPTAARPSARPSHSSARPGGHHRAVRRLDRDVVAVDDAVQRLGEDPGRGLAARGATPTAAGARAGRRCARARRRRRPASRSGRATRPRCRAPRPLRARGPRCAVVVQVAGGDEAALDLGARAARLLPQAGGQGAVQAGVRRQHRAGGVRVGVVGGIAPGTAAVWSWALIGPRPRRCRSCARCPR